MCFANISVACFNCETSSLSSKYLMRMPKTEVKPERTLSFAVLHQETRTPLFSLFFSSVSGCGVLLLIFFLSEDFG